jgi:hypothetical protein
MQELFSRCRGTKYLKNNNEGEIYVKRSLEHKGEEDPLTG